MNVFSLAGIKALQNQISRGKGLMPVAYYHRETTKAFQLYTYKNGSLFSDLFIRTWRVPDSVPRSVGVEILYEDEFIDSNNGGYYHYRDNPKLRYQTIVWDVYKKQVNTGTIRYDAEGNGDRPFNSIYIPYDIYLSERPVPRRLQVMIKWLS
jgi:hypothetical protein